MSTISNHLCGFVQSESIQLIENSFERNVRNDFTIVRIELEFSLFFENLAIL